MAPFDREAVIRQILLIEELARRDECRAYFLPGFWRNLTTLRECVGDDGALLPELVPGDRECIRSMLSLSSKDNGLPPGVGEVFGEMYRLRVMLLGS